MADDGTRVSGSILVYRLYDVAWDIDLARVEKKVREFKRQSIDRKRFSKAFQFVNPPLSLKLRTFEGDVRGSRQAVNVYAKVYDYGVVTIIFDLPFHEMAVADFEALAKNCEGPFREDLRNELDRLIGDLGDALHQVNRGRLEEDYTIYYLRQLHPERKAKDLFSIFDVAGLLLYEDGESPPSAVTKEELRPYTFSYSDNDLVVLSWDTALVLEPGGSMDIPDLLEFANAQLLELRVYDDMVDRELDIINDRMIAQVPPSIWKIKRYESLAARVMRTVVDLTAVTEKIDNAVKVTEDVYYSRVYTSALSLFKVRQWETSIDNKITIAARYYDMLYREISNKRTEFLEFIIVILIALEIVLFVLLKS